tara:strand:- start:19 stop:603 length:585 start_codon:yes stop_codon:yes gene_type:complete
VKKIISASLEKIKISKYIYIFKKYNLINFIFTSLIIKRHSYLGRYGIISGGGTASTNLINYVSKFSKVNCENNLDGFKHIKYIPKNKKIIYFYNLDFERVINSLRRRHFYYHNCAHLGSTLSLLFFFNHNISNYFFKKKLQAQISLHLNSKNSLCIEYKNIWKEKVKIIKFFKIKNRKEFLQNFPVKKPPEISF